jgi:cell wall-associated NlpC family hydrolase
MPRPPAASDALARSTLPARRVAPRLASATVRATPTMFASALQRASTPATPTAAQLRRASALPQQSARLQRTLSTAAGTVTGSNTPLPMSRSAIIDKAQSLMGIPYVWGGNSANGLDCSAFVSKAWGLQRQTTDTLHKFARPIGKDELRAGDALNLTTGRDNDGRGHVRLFDRWANPERTKMWVYEETPPRAVHHVINWDPSYTPLRRLNTID